MGAPMTNGIPISPTGNSTPTNAPTVDQYVGQTTSNLAQDPDAQRWAQPGWQQQALQDGKIAPQDQAAYNDFYRKTVDSRKDTGIYNIPAYWNNTINPRTKTTNAIPNVDQNGHEHWPDTYKLPSSQGGFSNDSKYANQATAPRWGYRNSKTGKVEMLEDEPMLPNNSIDNHTYSHAMTVDPQTHKINTLEYWQQPGKGTDHFSGANAPVANLAGGR